MQIFTIVYGQKHIDLFKRALCYSLALKDNRKTLQELEATWNIFTDDESMDEVFELATVALPKIKIKIKSTNTLYDYNDPIQSAFIWQMEECLKTSAKCLMAPPDTLFGDGTIKGLITAGIEKGTCVAMPHPRALPTILKELPKHIDNPGLVALAWKHLHKSWTDSKRGHEFQNSFVSGHVWDEVTPNLITVKHYLPTLYLCDFIPEDVNYFKYQATSFGVFDHVWPSHLVIPKGRQRTIGSSDVAFIVEITDTFANVPPLWPGDTESFWKNEAQHLQNKQFVTVFRKDEPHENPQETIAP